MTDERNGGTDSVDEPFALENRIVAALPQLSKKQKRFRVLLGKSEGRYVCQSWMYVTNDIQLG